MVIVIVIGKLATYNSYLSCCLSLQRYPLFFLTFTNSINPPKPVVFCIVMSGLFMHVFFGFTNFLFPKNEAYESRTLYRYTVYT